VNRGLTTLLMFVALVAGNGLAANHPVPLTADMDSAKCAECH